MLFDEKIYEYSDALSYPVPDYLNQLERETGLTTVNPFMSCGPVLGRLLIQLSQWIKPSTILEIGTFTGYSALCLIQGLKPGGKITCIEVNEEYEPTIRKYFDIAGVSHHLDLIIGDAVNILDNLHSTFDLAFIDANKQFNEVIFEKIYPLMRPGGIILVDNVLWFGKVVTAPDDKETKSILSFNHKISNDKRLKSYIIPIRDGLFVIEKL
ncbi:MAG: O-methyltransferase [Saprospiraceae bacterium]